MIISRICKECNEEKDIICFSFCIRHTRNNITEYLTRCKDCMKLIRSANKHEKSQYDKLHYKDIKILKKQQSDVYRIKNRETLLQKKRDYYSKNKDKISQKVKFKYANDIDFATRKKNIEKERYSQNKEKIKKSAKIYRINNKIKSNLHMATRRRTDPLFKLRHGVSSRIRQKLSSFNSRKNNKSITKYLQYSIQELKSHLEFLFEPWMTWNNHGIYNVNTWDDNDPSTWKWNIDHIIPHSTFKYTSMTDNEFHSCWSLKNLRPYSAKQNIIDGSTRKRH